MGGTSTPSALAVWNGLRKGWTFGRIRERRPVSLRPVRRPLVARLQKTNSVGLRARVRASWGLSGWRGNFCREALDGLSLAQSSPCRARSGRKTPAARRNGWLVARADRKSSLLPRVRASWGLSASGCTRSGRRSRPRMGSFQYRIKSQIELHERVVKESELSKA